MNRIIFIGVLTVALAFTGICFQPAAVWSQTESSDMSESDDLDFLDEYEEEEDVVQVADPIHYWNKAMFHVNDKLYFWVLKPVATGYKTITPTPVRIGVKNFFYNAMTPVRFVSCLLQSKSEAAGVELGRFMVNTVFGGLGFFTPADKEPKLKEIPPEEDFGQTLGLWGVGNGFYIVWPFLGPSTLRDSAGILVNMYLDPFGYTENPGVSFGLRGVETVNALSFRLGDYESLKEASLDPYEAFKNGYIQHRSEKISQ